MEVLKKVYGTGGYKEAAINEGDYETLWITKIMHNDRHSYKEVRGEEVIVFTDDKDLENLVVKEIEHFDTKVTLLK